MVTDTTIANKKNTYNTNTTAMDKDSFLSLFIKRLEQLVADLKSRNSSVSENEFYINRKVTSYDEEELINRELCEYIDTYYEKRKEFEAGNMNAEEWFEREVEKAATELIPDATEEEIEIFKKAVAEGIDKQTEEKIEALKITFGDVAEVAKGKEGNDEN